MFLEVKLHSNSYYYTLPYFMPVYKTDFQDISALISPFEAPVKLATP